VSAATERLAIAMTKDPDVFIVSTGTVAPYVDASKHYRQIIVIGRSDFGDESSQRLVERIRTTTSRTPTFPMGSASRSAGARQGVDFLNRVYNNACG